MPNYAKDVLQSRIEAINKELGGKTVGLLEERDALTAAIAALSAPQKRSKAAAADSDAIPSGDIINALQKLGRPALSSEVAEALGEPGNRLGKRMANMASSGEIKGDKDKGYEAP